MEMPDLLSVFSSREHAKEHQTYNRGNMVIQPSDRFVCRAYMSQQLLLIPLTALLVFGCAFPIDYLAGRCETGGEGWERWVWESVCGGGFLESGRLWTAGPPVRVSPHSEAEISAPENRG